MKHILPFVLLCAATAAWADTPPPEAYTQYFGAAAGFTTGQGFSYRLWPGNLGLQVTGIPVASASSQFYSLGLTGLLTVADYRNSRFFLYAGAGGNATSPPSYQPDSSPSPTWTSNIGAGAGVGLEFVAFDHLCFDVMTGYRYGLAFGSTTTWDFGLTGEAGLFYRL